MGERMLAVSIGLVLALTGCKSQTTTSELVDLSADGSVAGVVTTGHFIARHEWVVAYRFDCSKHAGTDGFGLDLHNADDDSLSDQHEGWHVPGRSGSGELMYTEAGPYYLDVVSHCQWNIRVKEQN